MIWEWYKFKVHPSVFTTLTEFDKFLEEHKSELMKIDDRDDLTDAEYEVQEMDIEQADQEVRAPGGQNMCKGGGGEGGGGLEGIPVLEYEKYPL